MSDTKSKHTPGPWSVYPQPISSKGDAILECIDQVQATESILDHIYLIDAGGKCAAIAGCGPTSAENARLIAAAPELLEACQQARSMIPDGGYTASVLDAAIAKATGSES